VKGHQECAHAAAWERHGTLPEAGIVAYWGLEVLLAALERREQISSSAWFSKHTTASACSASAAAERVEL
jgi:hypothetical protein